MLNNQSILVTGGTGSFGQKLVKYILDHFTPKKLIVFSRDELKQYEMSQVFSPDHHKCLRYFIGDVRDFQRLNEAFHNVDVVIHAAALKHVPICEYNPFEAILTNVQGAQNVIRAAIAQKVKKVMALSTDKAANPVNLYGASKLCADKLFIAGNAMSGDAHTLFSVVRYGNVFGSRGSVVPYFLKHKNNGYIPVTDARMTRFSLTLDQAILFVINSMKDMQGGEVFVPKIPSYRITDIAKAIAPECQLKIIGIRPGEKLHELMIPEDEGRHTYEFENHFVIFPDFLSEERASRYALNTGRRCPDGFSYKSDTNAEWLSTEQLANLIKVFGSEGDDY